MRNIIVLIILHSVLASLANAEMYKWIDENGSIHFSDKPMTSQKVEVYVPQELNSFESKSDRSNYSQQGAEGKQLKEKKYSKKRVLSKKETEEKERAEAREIIEREKNRPKSREERREIRRKRKIWEAEHKRRLGIY